MQRHFDRDLTGLKDKLLTMASHAEAAVAQAVKALVQRDQSLAEQVNQADATLDRFEIELDELCLDLLALKAPIASDLRLITMAMKITQNLERVGDEAAKIAKRARALNRADPMRVGDDIPRMADLATTMLRASLDAFVTADSALARATIERDAEVDRLNKRLRQDLIRQMEQEPGTISRCLDLMTVSKSLERIADHATNIAEDVVFLSEGRDIRHLPKARGDLPTRADTGSAV